MSELIDFLRARRGEDEQWALAASQAYRYAEGNPPTSAAGTHWRWVTSNEHAPVRVDPAVDEYVVDEAGELGGVVLVTVEEWPSQVAGRMMNDRVVLVDGEVRAVHAGHIARHDPARVLREVEAKRRILDGHPFEQGIAGGVCGTCHGAGHLEVHWDGEEENLEHVDTEMVWPCPTVRLLASVYADHPDYREEWRP